MAIPFDYTSEYKRKLRTPEEAARVVKAAEDNAKWRYNNYRRLAKQQWGVEQED